MALISDLLVSLAYFRQAQWPAFNFLQFNLLQKGSGYFGKETFTWFLTEGALRILNVWALPLAFSVFLIGTKRYAASFRHIELGISALFTIVITSMSVHKEDRFIMLLTTHFVVFQIPALESALNWAWHQGKPIGHSKNQEKISPKTKKSKLTLLVKWILFLAVFCVVFVNLLITAINAVYIRTGYHDILEHIQDYSDPRQTTEILYFLQPYTLPGGSHAPKGKNLVFLNTEWEPILNQTHFERQQENLIYPIDFLESHFFSNSIKFLVTYSQIVENPEIGAFLRELGCREELRRFYSINQDIGIAEYSHTSLVLMNCKE